MRSIAWISSLLICLVFTSFTLVNEYYGLASYYDDSFQGSETASKEKYDKNLLTGAHKTLPFGTLVKVTRLDNKKSVKVRINDRGPYIKGRVIEISRKAAAQIDLLDAGIARVKVEVIGTATRKEATSVETPPAVEKPVEVPNIENPVPDEFDEAAEIAHKQAEAEKAERSRLAREKTEKERIAREKAAAAEKAAEEAKTAREAEKAAASPTPKAIDTGVPASRVRGRDFSTYDLYKVQILRPERTGYGVQVASLTNYANVMRQVAELQERWFNNILISVEKSAKNEPIYKIMLGPFPDKATAKSYEAELKKKKKIDGFIVDLSGVKY